MKCVYLVGLTMGGSLQVEPGEGNGGGAQNGTSFSVNEEIPGPNLLGMCPKFPTISNPVQGKLGRPADDTLFMKEEVIFLPT